jgi:hypothetical protein
MGRRHREGRGRHPGAVTRSAARPFVPRPPYEGRSQPAVGEAVSPVPPMPSAPVEDLLQAAHVRPPEPSRGGVGLGPAGARPARTEAQDPALVPAEAERPPQLPVPSSRSGATPAQLRRFIKSRPYVPLHELRRRFGLNGHDDDVVSVDLADGRIWVGLPADEGRMLGELIRQGEVGCELSLDPTTPVVVGVFPIRPVARA